MDFHHVLDDGEKHCLLNQYNEVETMVRDQIGKDVTKELFTDSAPLGREWVLRHPNEIRIFMGKPMVAVSTPSCNTYDCIQPWRRGLSEIDFQVNASGCQWAQHSSVSKAR